jgi:hypothetical protein
MRIHAKAISRVEINRYIYLFTIHRQVTDKSKAQVMVLIGHSVVLLNLCEDNFMPSGRSPDKSAARMPSGSSFAS